MVNYWFLKPGSSLCLSCDHRNWIQQYNYVHFGRLQQRIWFLKFSGKIRQKWWELFLYELIAVKGIKITFLYNFDRGKINYNLKFRYSEKATNLKKKYFTYCKVTSSNTSHLEAFVWRLFQIAYEGDFRSTIQHTNIWYII